MQTDLEKFSDLLKERITTYPNWPTPEVDFKDIQSLLSDPSLTSQTLYYLFQLLGKNKGRFTKLLCFDARGFLFGTHIALAFDIPLIMARKPNKLPGEVISQEFKKEYGSDIIQVQKGLIVPGDKILVHDDALATGGTAGAAAEIVLSQGAEIAGFNFIIELGFLPGRELLEKYVSTKNITSLVTY